MSRRRLWLHINFVANWYNIKGGGSGHLITHKARHTISPIETSPRCLFFITLLLFDKETLVNDSQNFINLSNNTKKSDTVWLFFFETKTLLLDSKNSAVAMLTRVLTFRMEIRFCMRVVDIRKNSKIKLSWILEAEVSYQKLWLCVCW